MQWVTLLGVDDNVSDDNQTTLLTLTPSGGDYGSMSAQTLTVTTSDNDTVGLILSKSEALVSENGSVSDNFSVVLSSEPTDNVTLTVSDNDSTEVSASPTTLTFSQEIGQRCSG